jgi:hypothetical protein
MTKMQKRWTIRPNNSGPPGPWPVEARVAAYPLRRRTRQALNREFGKALKLRGAVKKSRLRKLEALAEKVPGYAVPAAATTALL